ncbi:MAG: 4-(cytidine 5'-diphospho)-2-C-methyl-D-erythritol kinase [Pseudomonadota bacterium]
MPGIDTVHAFAPAKINLTLHVTGQRTDGYHLLDSLVMLTDVGDHLRVRRADRLTLSVTGPRAAGVPTDHQNLVMRAAALLGVTAEITLEKHLPAAAGIGGGSSDAAATLRALATLYGVPVPNDATLTALGADVPVCMRNAVVRMQGIGDELEAVAEPPDWPMILVNPGVEVPTGPVFAGLQQKENPPMEGVWPGQRAAQVDWLLRQRNDLQTPAIATQPVIGEVLAELTRSEGCLLARMSGSGATCFAIMADQMARDAAVTAFRVTHPDWWVVPAQRCGDVFT